jgi:hypothetical protein
MMPTNLGKHCSAVTLLLVAGTALIIVQGPLIQSLAGTPLPPLPPAKSTKPALPASVSVIYGIDAHGKAEVVKTTTGTPGHT